MFFTFLSDFCLFICPLYVFDFLFVLGLNIYESMSLLIGVFKLYIYLVLTVVLGFILPPEGDKGSYLGCKDMLLLLL